METKGQRKRAERDTRRDFLFLILKSSRFVQKKKKKKKNCGRKLSMVKKNATI